MAVTASEKTYLGAIKPIGEKVILSFNRSAVSVDSEWIYDFLLDANYVITSLYAEKTVADLPATGAVGYLLYKVSAGTDATATETGIAQCGFNGGAIPAANAKVGTKSIAGLITPTVGTPNSIAAVSANIAAVARTTIHFNTAANSTVADPVQLVLANAPASGTTSGKQRLRLKVWANYNADAINPSALITIEVAKIAAITSQGTLAGQAGLTIDEVATPPAV